MQLGKTLVGGIIGAVVGIAVLIAVQHYRGLDQTWLSIVVAGFVGIGVRMMVSTSGHPSYTRGAITLLLALAAYFGGTKIYSELTTRGILAKKLPDRPVAQAPAAGEDAADEEGDAAAADPAADGATTAEADGVAVPVDPTGAETAPAAGEPAAGGPPAGEPAAAQPPPAEPVAGVLPRDAPKQAPMQPASPWEYVWLAIAALVAYELGRGSEPSRPRGPVIPPPDAT